MDSATGRATDRHPEPRRRRRISILASALLTLLFAAPLLAQSADRSKHLTTAAEQLLEFEKKMVANSAERIDDILFSDVLSLLDVAVSENAGNLHARALRAQTLLHQSDNGGGAYDICYILDAKGDAEFIVTRAQKASPADLVIARRVLSGIEKIPPDAIPDPPSVCDDEDEEHRGTRTKSR
jgi:hypothetical protein